MYEQFAKFYDELGWNKYAQKLWPDIKSYMTSLNFYPKTMLDLACGTGVLSICAAKDKLEVEGLDLSEEMLQKAKLNAREDNVNVNYYLSDMSKFKLNNKYDLITCTFDAINHMVSFNDWKSMFIHVHSHLNDNGMFIFDMNTLKDIMLNWDNVRVNRLADGSLTISKSQSFKNRAYVTFTAFIKRTDGLYEGYEERVEEAGFPTEKVFGVLKNIGFKDIKVMDRTFNEDYKEDLYRAFISCRK